MKREKARKRKGGKGEKKSTIGNKSGKRIDGRAQRTDKNRTKETQDGGMETKEPKSNRELDGQSNQ